MAAAVLAALGIAGQWRARRGHALVVFADLTCAAGTAIVAAAAAIADGAAVLARAIAARDGCARGAPFTKVILAGPAGRGAGAAGDGAATAVTKLSAAVLSAGWVAGRRHAAYRGHALVVGAHLIGRAASAVLGVTAVIADGAAILRGSGPARSWRAGGWVAGAQAAGACPAGLTRAACELAASAIADDSAVASAGHHARGEGTGIVAEATAANAALAGLSSRAGTAIEISRAAVADEATVQSVRDFAGRRGLTDAAVDARRPAAVRQADHGGVGGAPC